MIKILNALKNPDKLRRYIRWLAGKTRPFWPQLMLLIGVDLLALVISFGSSFISKNVVDTATTGLDFLPAFSVMILMSAASIGVGALTGVFRTLINEKFAFGIRLGVFDKILSANFLGLSIHGFRMLTDIRRFSRWPRCCLRR